MEITGNFSFFIDNIKQVDKIVNLQKYAEDGEVVFSVWRQPGDVRNKSEQFVIII